MPELPEVETVVRELKKQIVGRKFWKFEALNKSTFLPNTKVFEKDLPGKQILDIKRKGKYLIFVLSGDLHMVVHLRMTGMLTVEKIVKTKKYIRGIFTFSSGARLFFTDLRKFGKIYLYPQKEYLKKTGMANLGVDPIAEEFDLKILEKLYLNQKGILKNRLLDQSVIAGVGNIYADEICFRIGLHPSSRVERLKMSDVAKMHEAILHCLGEGIKHNGTTFSDFRGTRGDAGKHQKYLQVYGRTGDKCYVCETPIQKIRAAGRGTYFCVKCQKLRK